ncbi:MAG: ferritin family protein [Planctomycetes bacterium]|nr:ferritin family protein [Planctomycetota bacterium]
MPYFFNAEEIMEVAILIEKNGEQFYRLLIDETKDNDIKKICARLRDDEKKHQKVFEEMLKKTMSKKPASVSVKEFPEDDAKHLKKMADANVFTRNLSAKEIASKIKTDQETIRFALKIENESIAFYAQLRKFTSSDMGGNDIDKIIKEEQAHYNILDKLLTDKINPRETC